MEVDISTARTHINIVQGLLFSLARGRSRRATWHCSFFMFAFVPNAGIHARKRAAGGQNPNECLVQIHYLQKGETDYGLEHG